MIVDCHAHYLPQGYIDVSRGQEPEIRREGDHLFLGSIPLGPVAGRITSVAAILHEMDERGVAARVIAPPPFTFRYDADKRQAERLTRVLNDEMAAAAAEHPHRLLALGTVPLQHRELAIQELVRGVTELGLRGVIIGTQVQGVPLDDEGIRPFFEAAADTGAVVFIHPDYIPRSSLAQHYLVNLVGNPFETTAAIASLIFGSVLTRLPALQVLCAHGGGAAAFLIGRLHKGWTVRAEARTKLDRPPREVFRRLYFDSLTHSPASLEFLMNTVGSDRMLFGTDDPFDMADTTGLEDLTVAGRPLAWWAGEWSLTACRVFRIPLRTPSATIGGAAR